MKIINATSPEQLDNQLQMVNVRLIEPSEFAAWGELMAEHHYLGYSRIIGESIYYVATIEDQWVALIGWGSAALHCKARDQWIAWSAQLKQQRLYLVANNIRFLILPCARIKNLASKILSLNLKRLSRDWMKYYQHPIILAETFVDCNVSRSISPNPPKHPALY